MASGQPDTVPNSGDTIITQGKRRVWPVLVFLLLAAAVFAAAVWYVGGIGYLTSLGGQASQRQYVATPEPAQTPSGLALPRGVDATLAKRMYVEQVQSQDNLRKLAAGDVKAIALRSVVATAEGATVRITVQFSDGTSAPGVAELVKRNGNWYFMSITGLAKGSEQGSADSVGGGTLQAGRAGDSEVVAQSGVTDFDYGVMNTMLAQQVSNQPLLRQLAAGSIRRLSFGTPAPGAGTTSLPVTIERAKGGPAAGQMLLVSSSTSGQDLVFLTTLKLN